MIHVLRLVALLIVFTVPAVAGCNIVPKSGAAEAIPSRPARINHVVFFNLKDPNDAEELIRDCDQLLAPIPGVVSYFAGTHLDTGRGHVFGDYHVGMYVGYMTEEDYQVYVEHPNHVELVEKWRDRWNWIRVYDVLDERPR